MEQLRVFNITTDAENLGEALTGGDGTDPLRSAVGTIAADVTTRALETPLSIYLCSRDCDADLRNRFGFLLAKATLSRVPDTLVVDCDFLSPGLSGLAPSQTTLGFLDLLLYGSSLRVIANKAETGVNVIGAASFPVLQRVPFQTEAFVNTLRYLLSHARCVILLGPVFADTDDLHPIVQQVDLPFIVQSGDLSNARKFEQLEEKIISARDSLVWSIRCLHTVSANDDAETRAEGSAVGAAEDEAVDQILGEAVPLAGSGYDEAAGTTKEASTPEPAQAVELLFAEEGPGARLGEKKANSVFPKVITSFLGVFLIGFLLWWLYLTKSFRNDVDETAGPAPPTAEQSVDYGVSAAGPPLAVDSAIAKQADSVTALTTVQADQVDSDQAKSQERVPAIAEPQERTVREVAAADLSEHRGKYLLHVSSFRTIERAQSDADYLTGRGYDTVIARVDLGSKGLWYRVYVGPFDTQGKAKTTKIRLDENPRVRSTRITRVSG